MFHMIMAIVNYMPAIFAAAFAVIEYVYVYVISGEPISYPGGAY